MNIGFDISDLATNRADGTTRFTRELAARLPVLAATHQWQFFAPFDSNAVTAVSESKNVTKVIAPFPKYWTQLRLPAVLYRHPPDVLFMPIQQLPYIRPKKVKTVAVIHDLAFHHFGPQFTYKDWLLLHTFTSYVAKHADHIIAVSRATAADIAHFYGRTKNVHVIHHGVSHEQFHPPSPTQKSEAQLKLQTALPAIVKPYLLYVGQIQPRKNLIRLIDAFERVKQTRTELQLVIAGGHGWLQQQILARIAASPVKSSIIVTGPVPDELLAPLYWHAEAFILPSLQEGFGMPILEAQACGCPVVTSNTSSMPEVAGEGAVLVEPKNTTSIADGIQTALQNQSDLTQKGLANAQKFSWDATAAKVLKILLSHE